MNGSLILDDVGARLALAAAFEQAAVEWSEKARLTCSWGLRRRSQACREMATIARQTAERIRRAITADADALAAEECPLHDCLTCRPGLRSITPVLTWLMSDSLMREYWTDEMERDEGSVLRLALGLTELQAGVCEGRYTRDELEAR